MNVKTNNDPNDKSSCREKFPNDEASSPGLWSCSLCEKGAKWTQPSIARHLKTAHCLTIQVDFQEGALAQ